LDAVTGVFSWTPGTSEVGTTDISVTGEDSPTNGGVSKMDTKTLTVIVSADTLAPQNSTGGTFVAGGDTVTLTWDSVSGTSYTIESQAVGSSDWVDAGTVVASGSTSSVAVTNSGNDSHYRIVQSDSGASDQ
jgi:hypothetical protein